MQVTLELNQIAEIIYHAIQINHREPEKNLIKAIDIPAQIMIDKYDIPYISAIKTITDAINGIHNDQN